MKPYTLNWRPAAERDLAKLWLASSQRQAMADVADEIERQLADSPNDVGVAIHEGLRRLVVAPLYVQYSVDEGDRKVKVLSVNLTT
jgi:hypothetical protein